MRLVFIRVFSSEGSGREVPVHSSVWAQRRSVGSVCLFRDVSGVSHGPGLSLLRIPPGAPPAQPDSSGWAWAPSLTSDREDATAPSALPRTPTAGPRALSPRQQEGGPCPCPGFIVLFPSSCFSASHLQCCWSHSLGREGIGALIHSSAHPASRLHTRAHTYLPSRAPSTVPPSH